MYGIIGEDDINVVVTMVLWASGGIGRRARLKIWFSQESEGSIPSPPTNKISLLFWQRYFIL